MAKKTSIFISNVIHNVVTTAVGSFSSLFFLPYLLLLSCMKMIVIYYDALLLSLCQGDEESFTLKSCTRRKTDSIEKRFCFDVEAVDRSVSV